jgi:RNA polymerase sigma factor (sigma-70 family)
VGLFYGDLFAAWEIAVAKSAIINFQKNYPWLKGFEFEDLLQECLIHWYLNRASYKEDRGASIRTYMAKVVKNRLQVILREQQSDKRKAIHMAESLDKAIAEDETLHGEVLVDAESLTDHHLIHLDVEAVIESLTPLQRDICQLLEQEYPVMIVAEILRKPRTKVRDEIKRIKEIFLQKGLKNYLN